MIVAQPPESGTAQPPLRESERKRVTLRCEARIGSGAWSVVVLRDLSTEGCQIARIPGLKAGLHLRIRIPGLELLPATVRWVDDGKAGCAFDRSLSGYVLDHIVGQAGLYRG